MLPCSDFAWTPDAYGSTVDLAEWDDDAKYWESDLDALPFLLPYTPPAPVRHEDGMPLAYVSGPYRHPSGTYYVERNIRAAEAVAVELWKLGYAVICPHTNTKHMDGPIESETFLAGDVEILKRCDLVVVLPDWHRSEGARLEVAEANKAKVPVLSWLSDREQIETIGKGGKSALRNYVQTLSGQALETRQTT